MWIPLVKFESFRFGVDWMWGDAHLSNFVFICHIHQTTTHIANAIPHRKFYINGIKVIHVRYISLTIPMRNKQSCKFVYILCRLTAYNTSIIVSQILFFTMGCTRSLWYFIDHLPLLPVECSLYIANNIVRNCPRIKSIP